MSQDEDSVRKMYRAWIQEQKDRIECLESELKLACKYLDEARKRLVLDSTNSEVGAFIEKWGKE